MQGVLAERVGEVMVGAADVDGDGRVEVFLRDRVGRHDPESGAVRIARWEGERGLRVVWTAPVTGRLLREPNNPSLGSPGIRMSAIA